MTTIGALILLYHRVATPPSDPQRLAVSPRHFEQHLDLLRHRCHLVPLRELGRSLREENVPDKAVAITFDDGYKDNVDEALPILARKAVPATVFVATAYTGGTREFWWDDLERLILMPGRLPETIRLGVGGAVYEWRLGEFAEYTHDTFDEHAAWNVERSDDPTPRHRMFRTLSRVLRGTSPQARTAAIDELTHLAGLAPAGRTTHRAMSADDLRRLAASGLVEVGSHAETHTPLSALTIDAQRAEVAGSKSTLEAMTKTAAISFAYPFGGRGDYTPKTVGLVRDSGYVTACANAAGLVTRHCDPLQLPRVLVRNWDGDAFSARLEEWLRA